MGIYSRQVKLECTFTTNISKHININEDSATVSNVITAYICNSEAHKSKPVDWNSITHFEVVDVEETGIMVTGTKYVSGAVKCTCSLKDALTIIEAAHEGGNHEYFSLKDAD